MHLAMYKRCLSIINLFVYLVLEVLTRSHALGVILFDFSMQSHRRISLLKVLLLSHFFCLTSTSLH